MYIGVISMRYAKALLAYADEKGTKDTVYEEAGILADSFSRIPELRQALDNPVLPAETKLKLICEAAGGGKVSEELKRFVELVLEERREKFLQFMIMSYIDLYRKQKNISVSEPPAFTLPFKLGGRSFICSATSCWLIIFAARSNNRECR
jgi:F-type H+-transporting ATPase subunit delta